MAEIFVNDVRPDGDDSLSLVPRITTFEQLKTAFGLDVDTSKGEQRASAGQRYWALVGFEVRTGIAAYIPQVKDTNGNAEDSILVFRHWPGAPEFPSKIDPEYFKNGVGGFTDKDGVVGFGYSGGSVTGENGGPDHIWCSSDPPNGTRIGSDMASRLGWIGGTDHLTANPIFQDTRKGGIIPPPSGDAELRVFDKDGSFIGRAKLTNGEGSGGRIALYNKDIEQAHVDLE